jgi:hypothetical protein
MVDMSFRQSLKELRQSFDDAPEPSFKVSNYFAAYVELFGHLRGKECTFVETGVLNGGSLFMWRKWLGPQARIVGIDLNPEATKWREHGFEILIGDQGDPSFWKEAFGQIGAFDAFLDDGGHQSFQQIVTAQEAIRAAKRECVVVVEDTCTSFMREFERHRNRSFLEFSKDATDVLVSNTSHFFEGQFPPIDNPQSVEDFKQVYSIQFFSGIVAFKIDPSAVERPELLWNSEPEKSVSDFRYHGKTAATVTWPNPFVCEQVTVHGGQK